jgi:hypothetical protein
MRGPGQFLSPRGIAIHRELGQVFITEENGGRYLWIGTDVRDFQPRRRRGSRLLVHAHRGVDRDVAHSRFIGTSRRLDLHRRSPIRGNDARNLGRHREERRGCAGGDYVAEIRARATYSSKSSFEKKATRTFHWAPRS